MSEPAPTTYFSFFTRLVDRWGIGIVIAAVFWYQWDRSYKDMKEGNALNSQLLMQTIQQNAALWAEQVKAMTVLQDEVRMLTYEIKNRK